MNTRRLVACLVLLLSAGGIAACRSTGFYKTVSSKALDPELLAGADRFAVRPVDFTGVDKPSSYVTREQFLEEMRAEIPEFTEELEHQARDAGLSGRVMMVGADAAVSSGVIVEAKVVQVRLGWDFYSGGADTLVVDLRFIDSLTRSTVYAARVEASSVWTNNLAHKMNGSGGRLGIATWNLVRPIISVALHGKISPTSW